MKNWLVYFTFSLSLFPVLMFSQENIIDSYQDFSKRIKELDTNLISVEIQEGFDRSKKSDDTLGLLCYGVLNLKYLYVEGSYENSLNIVSELIPISEQFKDDSLSGFIYFYCGDAFYELEDIVDASRMFHKALEYFIKSSNLEWACRTEKMLALIQSIAGKNDEAIKTYNDCINKIRANSIKLSLSGAFNNMGLCYISLNEYDSALNCFDSSLYYYEIEKSNIGIARIFNNKATVYLKTNQPEMALSYYLKSFELRKKHKVGSSAISESLINIGKSHLSLSNLNAAKNNFQKGYEIGLSINSKELQKRALEGLKELYYKLGNFQKAFDFQKAYHELIDSLYGNHIRDELIVHEITWKFNNKIIKDSIAQSQKEFLHKEELKHQKTLQEQKNAKNTIIKTFLVIVIVMIGLATVFLFFRFREKKRLNEVILSQKEELQQKQMEIVDSINYAKHLQDAILPSRNTIESFLEDSFVFYQPKAIVAGDFYWIEKTKEKIIFAVADCTGHGVPGAMVSMICHGALNRAVREFNLLDTGMILDKTRDLVAEYFIQSEKDIRDGMDIAICAWDFNSNTIQYSGANNPIWYVRDNTINEIKPSKQSVGITTKYLPFETHEVQLKKNDVFYLFTDGFPDQFGGERGKKYKYKRFKELLLKISSKTVNDQKNALEKEFLEWKKDFEQVDDVCVMGVRL